MKPNRLLWLPRFLILLLAGFLAMFAFDVFEGSAPWPKKLLGFAIHLMPTWLLLLVLAVAWKNPRLGGFVSFGVAVFFAILFRVWVSMGNVGADLIRTGIVCLTVAIGVLLIALGKRPRQGEKDTPLAGSS